MLAPGGEAPPPLALAVSVTGQQARLELRSKVANILVPNLRAHGNVVGCFLVLAQTNKMVNGAIGSDFNGTQLLVDGPHFNTTGAEVEAFIRDRVEAALPDRREALLLRTRVLPASRTPAYWGDSLWAQKYGTAGKDFDLAGQVERQQMHLDQWDHLRQTWVMIDASERRCDGGLRSAQVPCHFDCVLRLRDDTYALAPMVVPPRPARETQWGSWSSAGMLSLGCLKWGGVMDAHFLLGRQSAMAIMTGLLTDFYLEHLTATPPENAESWLAHVADTHHVDVVDATPCDLPFVSVRFVAHPASPADVSVATKPSHRWALVAHKGTFACTSFPCTTRAGTLSTAFSRGSCVEGIFKRSRCDRDVSRWYSELLRIPDCEACGDFASTNVLYAVEAEDRAMGRFRPRRARGDESGSE